MTSWLLRVWYSKSQERPLLRVFLMPLEMVSWVWTLAVHFRNFLFDSGIFKTLVVPNVKVVSIGNLNVGGAGKTPTVIEFANRALRLGHRVLVVSRGYGRASRTDFVFDSSNPPSVLDVGDEPFLIAQRCPGVTVCVGRRRARLAMHQAKKLGATLILLDDGMQHRKLFRDVDVLVVDAQALWGNEKVLPRGPLREPLSAQKRAHVVVVRTTKDTVAAPCFAQPTVKAFFEVESVIDEQGRSHSPDVLSGVTVVSICALARPQAFQETLILLGAKVLESVNFPDHHSFTFEECHSVFERAKASAAIVVTTEKDCVRWPKTGPLPWVVSMRLRIIDGSDILDRVLSPPPQENRLC